MNLRYNKQRHHWECVHRVGGIDIKLWPNGTFFLNLKGKGRKRKITMLELANILNKMKEFAIEYEGDCAIIRLMNILYQKSLEKPVDIDA